MRRIVLTGGPFSGKTTLVERLRQLGHPVVPEAALRVIDGLTRQLGLDEQVAWRQANVTEFQARIARMQRELESAAQTSPTGTVFFDRGVPDGIAFCRVQGAPLPAELVDVDCHYDAVALLDTLDGYDVREASGRFGDRGFSLEICRQLRTVYTDLGTPPSSIPIASIEERLERVLALRAEP